MISVSLNKPIDPLALERTQVTLPTNHGMVAGSMAIIVPGACYVSLEPVRVGNHTFRRGTSFVYRHDGRYQGYGSIYKAIRAHMLYVTTWTSFNLRNLGPLSRLSEAYLANLFGLATLPPGGMVSLNTELQTALATGGESFTSHERTRHAIKVLVRTATKTRRGSQLLGFGNSNGKIAERLQEMQRLEHAALSIGVLFTQYLGAVQDVLAAQRERIDDIMRKRPDDFVSEETEAVLHEVYRALSEVCIVRPTTRAGYRAAEDCYVAMQWACLLRLQGAESGVSVEDIRVLVSNVRDSLDLLRWQYDLEQTIALIAGPAHKHEALLPEEGEELHGQVTALAERIGGSFGAQFENTQTMPELRMRMRLATTEANVLRRHGGSPTNVKHFLSTASGVIDGTFEFLSRSKTA